MAMASRRDVLKGAGSAALAAMTAPLSASEPENLRWPSYRSTLAIDGLGGPGLLFYKQDEPGYAAASRARVRAQRCGNYGGAAGPVLARRQGLQRDEAADRGLEGDHRAPSRPAAPGAHACRPGPRRARGQGRGDLHLPGHRTAGRGRRSHRAVPRAGRAGDPADPQPPQPGRRWLHGARQLRIEQLRPRSRGAVERGEDRRRPRARIAAHHPRRHSRLEGAGADQPYRLPRAGRRAAPGARRRAEVDGRSRRRRRDHLLAPTSAGRASKPRPT